MRFCAFLPSFMEDYNRRFAKPPYSDKDLHRLSVEEERSPGRRSGGLRCELAANQASVPDAA